MPVAIEPVRAAHLPDIATLAGVIWRAHYPGILSPAQIEHMLARLYAVDMLRRELDDGVAWFRALIDGALVGFTSASAVAGTEEFKLHKLYIHPKWQRLGIGGVLLCHIGHLARARGAATLILNVNRRNASAIAAYTRHGFTLRESVVVDIGGGFVMDDDVMEKRLRTPE